MTKQFVELVQRMREAQNRYFRGRTQQALRDSRTLESAVDQAVLEFLDPPPWDTQANLFKEDQDK